MVKCDGGERESAGGATPLQPFGPNWIIAENQPCQLYNPYPEPDETVTWSGACVNGKASGEGRQVWRTRHGELVFYGGMRDGKVHGQGTYTTARGTRYEGEWRDGKRQGQVTITFSNGAAKTCEFRDDKRVTGTCKSH